LRAAADVLAAVDYDKNPLEALRKCGIRRLVNCRRPVQTRVLPLEYQSVPVVYDESGPTKPP
jgi:hypothetical protein